MVKHSKIALVSVMMSLLSVYVPVLRAEDYIARAGDVLQYALPATAVGLIIAHDDGDGAIQFASSAALTVAVTYALKFGINARRPNGGNHSFPSGHTSISFSAAEFMRNRYGIEYGAPAYALASFVGYSRVESDNHYIRDVVAGAGIGALSSLLFTTPYEDWNVSVNGDAKSIGVRLGHQF
jgi:membrane-associated phospholipid phosphatase